MFYATLFSALIIVLIILYIVFIPRHNRESLYRKIFQRRQRRLIEDALKHIFHCESQGIACTIQSVAGALSINIDKATKLISRIEELSLVIYGDKGIELTKSGRRYALAIIRTHRLWELYLAMETGVAENDWHSLAEIKEHKLSTGEVEELSRLMRHPRYDPHGAPIPTQNGELPPMQAIPLTNLGEGVCAQIVNIEDEPKTVYAQINAFGFYHGMKLKVIEQTFERITLLVRGYEVVLAPLFAANIQVVPVPSESVVSVSRKTLAELPIGKQSTVCGISRKIHGQQRRRLMDIGIIPGTEITAAMKSPVGNPTAYIIKGASIALRREQAQYIYIDYCNGDEE